MPSNAAAAIAIHESIFDKISVKFDIGSAKSGA
jgi:hypothetical protein